MSPRVASRQGRNFLRRLVGRKSTASSLLSLAKSEVAAPTKISKKVAFQEGQNILECSTSTQSPDLSDSSIVLGDANASNNSNTLVSGAMPISVQPQLTQESFIDALTAVMTGDVDVAEDEDHVFEDHSSLSSIGSSSTVSSHVKVIKPAQESPVANGNASLGVGKLFFYLDQKGMAKPSMPQSIPETEIVAGTTSSPIDEISVPSQTSTKKSRTLKSSQDNGFNVRELVERKAREADREGLFELGESMYRRGELLLAQGKVEEARDALERAQTFQKHSLRIIVKRMAESMHKQGLQHCDRGDKFLAVILLGVAEILKKRPSPEHIKLGAQVHLGYRKICPKEKEFRALRAESDKCLRELEKEALPMSRTMKAVIKCNV